jgi:leucyl aminopeptidase
MPLQIIPSDESPLTVSCDALVGAASSAPDGPFLAGRSAEVDAGVGGRLARHLNEIGFKGNHGDVEVLAAVPGVAAKSIAIVGLGPPTSVDPNSVRRLAGSVVRRLQDRPVLASLIHDIESPGSPTTAAAEGFQLGAYQFTKYKSDARPSRLERVLFLGPGLDAAIAAAQTQAEATTLARDLVNEPASTLTPEALAARATEIADVAGLECSILDDRELADGGFGGIVGVGKGSHRPPRLIRMRHHPNAASGRIALIGKGITFDTGGLSLKDARGMENMKTDMAGAAAVMATMSALGRLDVSTEVLALVPACENMPGGNALKPGDVIKHYGGRTTEVNNTDAEGRLVLGDALALACEEDIDAVVDVATLTGGISVALGRKSTGLFANDDALARAILDAADTAGERTWRLPLYDDYKRGLDSDVADMKNSAGRDASSITAALFLREFVRGDVAWAHLDIAGTARAASDYDEVTRGGTGTSVRTLLEWIKGRSR